MNVKNLLGGLFAAAFLFGSAAVAEEANEWMPSISLDAKWASRYMSKGKICTPESMSFYDLSLSLKGFYVGIWVANDHNDYNMAKGGGVQYEPEEIDYYVGYAYTFEDVPVVNSIDTSIAYAYFDYPHRLHWTDPEPGDDDFTSAQKHEASVTANLGVFMHPGVKICWDPEFEIWYGNFNASYDYNFKDQGCEKLTASTGFELWWGNNRFLGNDKHDNDLALTTFCWTVSLDYAITENITFGPFGTLAWALDPAYRDSWKGDSPNDAGGMNTVWGVHVNFSF